MIRFARNPVIGPVCRILLYLKLSLRLLWAAAFNEADLREFAELYTHAKIDEWLALARITPAEADRLRDRIYSPAVTEYLKGFMLQLGLIVFELPLINNVIVIVIALVLNELMVLLYFFLVPVLRTLYTLSRMWRNRHREISYGTALVIGAIPKAGTFAYPLQLFSTHPNLSRFLVRSQACAWVESVPLIGGHGSQLERIVIRITDWMLSIIHLVVQTLEWIIRAGSTKAPRR